MVTLWTLLGLAVVWAICTIWACCVAAKREDAIMEAYYAKKRRL
jgi:hypothetical protein